MNIDNFISVAQFAAQSSFDYTTSSTAATGASAGLTIFVCFFYILICILAVVALGVLVYQVIDATNRDFGQDSSMLTVWILILIFLGFPIGSLLYYFVVMRKYPKKGGAKVESKTDSGNDSGTNTSESAN